MPPLLLGGPTIPGPLNDLIEELSELGITSTGPSSYVAGWKGRERVSLDTSRQSHDLYLICSFSFLSPIHVRVQDPKQREVRPPGPQSPCPFPFSLSLVPHHS